MGEAMRGIVIRSIIASGLALLLAGPLRGQERAQVEIHTTQLAEHLYALIGVGGNVVLSVSEQGGLLVDSGYPGLTDHLVAAIRQHCDKPIRLLVNTHWHFDHVGGNETLAAAGALIIAHENVQQRMSGTQHLHGLDLSMPPAPPGARPVITFEEVLTVSWEGAPVCIIHVPPAHTDGDCFVHFTAANVLHVGDIWFNGSYPYIDINAGGSLDGMIAAADRALALADDETQIVPGHGPVGRKPELQAYRDMLVAVRDRIDRAIRAGQSREDVIAGKPTRDFDARHGQFGFDPDTWVGLAYDAMTRSAKP